MTVRVGIHQGREVAKLDITYIEITSHSKIKTQVHRRRFCDRGKIVGERLSGTFAKA